MEQFNETSKGDRDHAEFWFSVIFETSCTAGAPLLMKTDILEVVPLLERRRPAVDVYKRVFETVLRCLDEPLLVASPARAVVRARRRY
jgi:hypothetical protein